MGSPFYNTTAMSQNQSSSWVHTSTTKYVGTRSGLSRIPSKKCGRWFTLGGQEYVNATLNQLDNCQTIVLHPRVIIVAVYKSLFGRERTISGRVPSA